jgi:hypothetical protein
MPRDIAFDATQALRHDALLPVSSPAQVWVRAQRTFAAERLEQLPLRAKLLDVLEQLDRGHLLALAGAASPTVWLTGHPDISLLAGVLFGYGYVQIAGCHRLNPTIVYFSLSAAGRRKLLEGRSWWNRLSLWQRLLVRVFG